MRTGKILIVTGLVVAATASGSVAMAAAPAPTTPPGTVPGLDVSAWQTDKVNWADVAAKGAKFAIIRATRGNATAKDNPAMYVDPFFQQNKDGARNNGILQGAYHFASPHKTDGATQADHFVNNGGGWVPDGKTLPGALDMESDPYAKLPKVPGVRTDCYNITPQQMIEWIRSFSQRYFQRTGRYPFIYANRSWWKNCTSSPQEPDGTAAFANTNPLWVANYQRTPTQPLIPGGFPKYTVWQFWNGSDKPLFPGDQNAFPGTYQDLVAFASKRDKPVAYVGVKGKASGKFRRGKKATYEIHVGNGGPDYSGPVTLYAKLPKGVKYRKVWTRYCTKKGNALACTFTNLKPGQLYKFKFGVTLSKSAAAKLNFKVAIKASTVLDPYTKNNKVTIKAKVTR